MVLPFNTKQLRYFHFNTNTTTVSDFVFIAYRTHAWLRNSLIEFPHPSLEIPLILTQPHQTQDTI